MSLELDTPENLPENRLRIRREILDVLKDHSSVLPKKAIEELIDVVTAELVELRERIAERIIEPVIGRYENGITDTQLTILQHVILQHYEDAAGEIQLLKNPEDPLEPKLRLL